MTSRHEVLVMFFTSVIMVFCHFPLPSTAQDLVFRETTSNVDEIIQSTFGSSADVISTRTSSAGSTSCTASNKLPGRCLLLSQCPIYMPFVKDIHIPQVSRFFRDSICRLEVNNVRICCPNDPRQAILPTTSGGFAQPQPPSQNTQPSQIDFSGSTKDVPSQNLPARPSLQNRPRQTTTTVPRFGPIGPTTQNPTTQNRPFNPPSFIRPVLTTTNVPRRTSRIPIQNPSNQIPSTQDSVFQLPSSPTRQPLPSLPVLPPQSKPLQPTEGNPIVQEPQPGVPFIPDRQTVDQTQQTPNVPEETEPLTNIIPSDSECGDSSLVAPNKASPAWPWLAAVGYVLEGESFEVVCGGALITRRHVLAAAHCMTFDSRRTPTHVRIGDYDLDRSNDVAFPQEFLITGHKTPGYDKATFTKDITLITLSQDVIFNDFIQPVCLPYRFKYDGFRYQNLSVVGWRYTSMYNDRDDEHRTSHILESSVIGNSECSRAYKRSSNSLIIDRKNLCAVGGDSEECLRDSGAPALFLDDYSTQRYFLVGMASYGFGCVRPAEPNVYTRIGAYLDWIEQNVR